MKYYKEDNQDKLTGWTTIHSSCKNNESYA